MTVSAIIKMEINNKTYVRPLHDDILVISHKDGVEITKNDIRSALHYIRETYPDRKCVIIDHIYSYSLEYGAIEALAEIDDFHAMASVVHDESARKHVESMKNWFIPKIPFESFSNIEDAICFVRRLSGR